MLPWVLTNANSQLWRLVIGCFCGIIDGIHSLSATLHFLCQHPAAILMLPRHAWQCCTFHGSTNGTAIHVQYSCPDHAYLRVCSGLSNPHDFCVFWCFVLDDRYLVVEKNKLIGPVVADVLCMKNTCNA